jgi:hypothetical protein
MASRNSNQDSDGLVYSTASLKLGTQGLDLRKPADPGTLTKLLNARFSDEKTIERRRGYRGVLVQDGSSFPPVGDSVTPTEWVYSHGLLTSEVGPNNQQDAHHPVAGRGGLVFDHNGANVVWTGDRLMTLREDGNTALGGSRFWYRHTVDGDGDPIDTSTALSQGIPAFLPLQTDSNPPNSLASGNINTCLTKTLRVTVDTSGTTGVNAWTTSRGNGAVIHHGDISGASNSPVDARVVNSGEIPVAIWRDTGDNNMYWCHWTGSTWSPAAVLVASVATFDVVAVTGGFHVFYRVGAVIKAIKFSGVATQTTPYPVNTVVITTGSTPSGAIAAAADPAGNIAVVWEDSTKLNIRVFKSDLTNWSDSTLTTLVAVTGWNGGVSVVSRGLIGVTGDYDFIVHASAQETAGFGTYVFCYRPSGPGGVLDATVTFRYGCHLASKSFRVGNEVFCWLTAVNSETNFLLAGSFLPVVAGYCDREESHTDGNGIVSMVLPDPLDSTGTKLTWARRINTGQSFARGGDARIGDLDFLPHPTVARYGKSTYISGSAVRNWDGVTLADAGFQETPTVTTLAQGTGGSLTLLAAYNWRVYAVRYNALGERFESAAVTKGRTLSGSNNQVFVTIAGIASTSHDDVVLEVYRTEGNGTTFYLDGTIANSFAGPVVYTSTVSDTVLRTRVGDPHAPGVGVPAEIETFGPLGCAFLASAGDRLWGAGGQVPAGTVQFSKLWDQNFAAGFDDLAGFQVVDIQGGEITSIAAFNDAIVIQEADRISVIGGGGPDNFGVGAFSTPEIRLSDGAITPYGTALTPAGLVYWGADGPRILGSNFQTECICSPVKEISAGLLPTGVHVDFVREEVIWHTADGTALLWNFRGGSRWAEWSGLRAAHAADGALITPEALVLIADETAGSDAGNRFEFSASSGQVRPEDILTGATMVRRIGISGEFLGDHQLRFRVFYNGSPLWAEETIWSPTEGTWLTSAESVATLTPAQVDALNPVDHSGAYATHKRVSRESCRFLRLEFSDMGSYAPTLIPYELVFELGSKPGLGRVPVNTFTDS